MVTDKKKWCTDMDAMMVVFSAGLEEAMVDDERTMAAVAACREKLRIYAEQTPTARERKVAEYRAGLEAQTYEEFFTPEYLSEMQQERIDEMVFEFKEKLAEDDEDDEDDA